jgi:HPr kinase/phosphorylase
MTVANVHASCVCLAHAGQTFGIQAEDGVLLLGDSGAGKSDLALRLIAQGARFVADDRVELFVRDGALWARAPANLAGLLEARGLGIVALPFAREERVALVIRLVAPDAVPRMPSAERYEPPAPLELAAAARPPVLSFAAHDPSTPAKIILAAAAFAHALFREESNPE